MKDDSIQKHADRIEPTAPSQAEDVTAAERAAILERLCEIDEAEILMGLRLGNFICHAVYGGKAR